MTTSDLLGRRLVAQRLTGSKFNSVADAVEHLLAVQSQDYGAAKWALAQRLNGVTEAGIDAAFNAGEILRTHVLRPTWHFVTPDDIGWLLELTGGRVLAAARGSFGRLGLAEANFARAEGVLTEALAGGHSLTRSECDELFRAAGIKVDSDRAPGLISMHLMMHAELTGIIASAPLRGKQHTYALLEERAPKRRSLERPAALAQLARRYFTSHGPATARDLAWWSGLTITDINAGIKAAAADLASVELDLKTYWTGRDEAVPTTDDRVFLLPNYDEYIIAYTGREEFITNVPAAKLDSRGNAIFQNTLVLGGRVVGTWRRTLKAKVVEIELTPFGKLTLPQQKLIRAAADDYAAFVGRTADTRFL